MQTDIVEFCMIHCQVFKIIPLMQPRTDPKLFRWEVSLPQLSTIPASLIGVIELAQPAVSTPAPPMRWRLYPPSSETNSSLPPPKNP